MDATGEAMLFEALIVPHRSLSRRGLWIVGAAFAACLGLIAIRFWFLGAWPVIGFSILEIPLAVVLLVINTRRGRASELVLLGEETLRIVRTDPAGRRQERSLPVAWLRVNLEEAAGRIPRLMLRAQSGQEEVAAALGEAEKRDLAEALRHALYDTRHPRFDNPQLRD